MHRLADASLVKTLNAERVTLLAEKHQLSFRKIKVGNGPKTLSVPVTARLLTSASTEIWLNSSMTSVEAKSFSENLTAGA